VDLKKHQQTEGEAKYHKGWLPIPDTRWKVETIENNEFVCLGEIFVSGKLVAKEMDAHRSIKGYEPQDIAEQVAHKKFAKRLKIKGKPLMKPVIVSRIWDDE